MNLSIFFQVLPLALLAATIPRSIAPSNLQHSKRALLALEDFPGDAMS